MPREARIKSSTGVYHVMLRGVNRQELFLDEEDYYQMIDTLQQLIMPMDENGRMIPSYCTIFAWCIMSNHLHILIQEKTEPIGETIKRLEVSYAYYYNKKYGRESTLFHDRFRSEPCEDYNYFWRLLKYIHRNPVKAGITEKVEQYKWSSWHELLDDEPIYFPIVNVPLVKRQMLKFGNTIQDLIEFVNDQEESEDDNFIDMPEDNRFKGFTDEEAWKEIQKLTNVKDPTSFQQLDRAVQKEIFSKLKKMGARIKQLQRLTGIGRNIIQRS